MSFNCTDINTFKAELDNNLSVVQTLKKDSHASIKIQSLLNITIYALATRFLEGSVKLIIYNCAIMRGDDSTQLSSLETELKKINNPEYSNIKIAFDTHLGFDISTGNGPYYSSTDLTFLNEIVRNRHRNVHASHEPSEWYSKNVKDVINDFPKEYLGLLKILEYLDSIRYDSGMRRFVV